ncbi:MAG: D-arabinono-1,4-lactone oxidase [Pirellulaceae bacterium]
MQRSIDSIGGSDSISRITLVVIFLATILRSGSAIRFFYRWLFPRLTITGWSVTDRSDKNLLMGHELFRHLELEFFVPRRHVEAAAALVREVVDLFAGTTQDVSTELRERLAGHGLPEPLLQKKGTFTQHYVICVRKILPDDTQISMASGDQEPWYSFSLITYAEPREPFYAMAELLARCSLALYGGRLHWGKWFPLRHDEIEATYPHMESFRRLADEFDPESVFRNDFTARVLGLSRRDGRSV